MTNKSMSGKSFKELLISPIQQISLIWQNFPLAIKGVLVISLPLIILLFSFLNLYLEEQKSISLENRLREILTNQQNIKEIHAQLLEASTAVRDYLLTGDKHFLKTYELANKKIPSLLADLKQNVKDSEVKRRCDNLPPLILENLASLRAISKSNLDKSSDSLVSLFKNQTDTLNTLRIEIEKIDNRESLLIKSNLQLVNQQRQHYINLNLLLAFISILGSLCSAWYFSKTIVNRIRILRDNAIKLAHGEPLVLPKTSLDELGQLSEELDHASQLLAKSVKDANSAKLEALEASASKSMFLSRTSHELRTPLNAILGFAQLLEEDLTPGKQRDSVSLIKGAGEHLLKLINEVLEIARIESGEISLELNTIAIDDLLEEAKHYIAPIGKIRDIDITCQYEPNLWVLANRQKLLQVVLNLLSNALKYGPAGSNVYLKAHQKQDMVLIEVLDEGAGIPDPLKARLFVPFDRLGAEQTKVEGTGLGLAVCKQIMRAMHGNIDVANDKSLFWIEIPSSIPSQSVSKQHQQKTETALPTLQNKHTLLYVEDNASNRTLVEAIIKRQKDLQIHCVATIKDAKQMLSELTPSLLLIDLNLPDGSGELLVSHVKSIAQLAHIPIMILSADALEETIKRTEAAGVDYYLTKPLDVALFNRKIRELLSKQESYERS